MKKNMNKKMLQALLVASALSLGQLQAASGYTLKDTRKNLHTFTGVSRAEAQARLADINAAIAAAADDAAAKKPAAAPVRNHRVPVAAPAVPERRLPVATPMAQRATVAPMPTADEGFDHELAPAVAASLRQVVPYGAPASGINAPTAQEREKADFDKAVRESLEQAAAEQRAREQAAAEQRAREQAAAEKRAREEAEAAAAQALAEQRAREEAAAAAAKAAAELRAKEEAEAAAAQAKALEEERAREEAAAAQAKAKALAERRAREEAAAAAEAAALAAELRAKEEAEAAAELRAREEAEAAAELRAREEAAAAAQAKALEEERARAAALSTQVPPPGSTDPKITQPEKGAEGQQGVAAPNPGLTTGQMLAAGVGALMAAGAATASFVIAKKGNGEGAPVVPPAPTVPVAAPVGAQANPGEQPAVPVVEAIPEAPAPVVTHDAAAADAAQGEGDAPAATGTGAEGQGAPVDAASTTPASVSDSGSDSDSGEEEGSGEEEVVGGATASAGDSLVVTDGQGQGEGQGAAAAAAQANTGEQPAVAFVHADSLRFAVGQSMKSKRRHAHGRTSVNALNPVEQIKEKLRVIAQLEAILATDVQTPATGQNSFIFNSVAHSLDAEKKKLLALITRKITTKALELELCEQLNLDETKTLSKLIDEEHAAITGTQTPIAGGGEGAPVAPAAEDEGGAPAAPAAVEGKGDAPVVDHQYVAAQGQVVLYGHDFGTEAVYSEEEFCCEFGRLARIFDANKAFDETFNTDVKTLIAYINKYPTETKIVIENVKKDKQITRGLFKPTLNKQNATLYSIFKLALSEADIEFNETLLIWQNFITYLERIMSETTGNTGTAPALAEDDSDDADHHEIVAPNESFLILDGPAEAADKDDAQDEHDGYGSESGYEPDSYNDSDSDDDSDSDECQAGPGRGAGEEEEEEEADAQNATQHPLILNTTTYDVEQFSKELIRLAEIHYNEEEMKKASMSPATSEAEKAANRADVATLITYVLKYSKAEDYIKTIKAAKPKTTWFKCSRLSKKDQDFNKVKAFIDALEKAKEDANAAALMATANSSDAVSDTSDTD